MSNLFDIKMVFTQIPDLLTYLPVTLELAVVAMIVSLILSLAVIYWIITIIVEQGIKLIEKKIRIPENAPAIQTDEGALNQ